MTLLENNNLSDFESEECDSDLEVSIISNELISWNDKIIIN